MSAAAASSRKSKIFQFNIKLRLLESTPSVWRRVQIYSDNATFWDLHCAIQKSMGWNDTHYHCFEVKNLRNGNSVRIGKQPERQICFGLSLPRPVRRSFISFRKPTFPTLDMKDAYASWDTPLSQYYSSDSPVNTEYRYMNDFGDDWVHDVAFEGVYDAEPGKMYPLCIGGERACPPEDTGSIHEFKYVLAIIKKNPAERKAAEREKMEWLDKYWPNYDPNFFDPSSVVFVNANEWLKFKKANIVGSNYSGEGTGFKQLLTIQEKPTEK